jgi:hypothetical protein
VLGEVKAGKPSDDALGGLPLLGVDSDSPQEQALMGVDVGNRHVKWGEQFTRTIIAPRRRERSVYKQGGVNEALNSPG